MLNLTAIQQMATHLQPLTIAGTYGYMGSTGLMCDPLTPSKYPLGLERLMFLADVYSQMNLHTCVKFGPDRSSGLEAFPDLCINDPQTSMPVGYREVNFLADVHSQMNMHTCVKFYPDRSSGLRQDRR